MRTGDPNEHGDGAKFFVAESSPVVGNLAIALYVGGFGGPMLGTFESREAAYAFIADVQAVIVKHGGEPLPVVDE